MVRARPVAPSLWRSWVLATRVPTLTAAVTPVLVGTAAAARVDRFDPGTALAALGVALAIQIGTNFANDALDFLRGADHPARLGPPRVTQSGVLSSRQVLTGAYLCFGLAAFVGLRFAAIYGWPVLVVGALSIAAGLAYTAGPWPLGYHGLGELFVFLFFGVVAVVGSAFVQTGRIEVLAIATSVPVGMLATAILVVNNLRDIQTDRLAGKRTLAVRLGEPGTRCLYAACVLGAGASPALLRAAGTVGPWFWLPWIILPLIVRLALGVLRGSRGQELNPILRQTARVHLLFGALLSVSLLR